MVTIEIQCLEKTLKILPTIPIFTLKINSIFPNFNFKKKFIQIMPESPPHDHSHGGNDENCRKFPKRPCDFCNESTALLYCRADTAKLCLSCDREVHSTNQLFTKHTRSLLCDACDSSPASIYCSTDAAVHCQNCDWETHNKSGSNSSPSHDRRPVEGFTGCPSVADLLSILGFEDLGKKGLSVGDGPESYGSGDGFSDYLVWDTPSFVSLDDLIVSSGSDHNYQAMGVPPLPKNRNAACGTYKDELLRQLRQLAKSEPNVDNNNRNVFKSLNEFQSTETSENIQLQDMFAGFEHKSEQNIFPSYEANAFEWCDDPLVGYNGDANCLVPDKDSDIVHSSSHNNGGQEGELQYTTASAIDNVQVLPAVVVRDINSHERETAISRYKEKKRSRRYDKHIRYESRKVRAESRTRIRGRFAKMDRRI